MSYLGREASAHLTGEQWVKQLNALTREEYLDSRIQQLLIQAPYQKAHVSNIDIQQLITATENWISALPKKKQELDR